jgi:hypothetical protein
MAPRKKKTAVMEDALTDDLSQIKRTVKLVTRQSPMYVHIQREKHAPRANMRYTCSHIHLALSPRPWKASQCAHGA